MLFMLELLTSRLALELKEESKGSIHPALID
jgi:hypothetical protein